MADDAEYDRRPADPELTEFGHKLKAFRKRRHLTLEAACENGPTRKIWSLIEAGRSNPSRTTLAKIDRALNLRPGGAESVRYEGTDFEDFDRLNPPKTQEAIRLELELSDALARWDVSQAAARDPGSTGRGPTLTPQQAKKLIEILNSIPRPESAE